MRKVTKSKSSSIVRRKKLIKFIFRKGIEMRPYTNCIKSGKRYVTDRNYDKYIRCIRGAKSSCNLVISQKNWNKLDTERVRFFALFRQQQARRAAAIKKLFNTDKKSNRLKRLQELLKTRIRKIIIRETQNIKKLKTNKFIKVGLGISNFIDLALIDFPFFFRVF